MSVFFFPLPSPNCHQVGFVAVEICVVTFKIHIFCFLHRFLLVYFITSPQPKPVAFMAPKPLS